MLLKIDGKTTNNGEEKRDFKKATHAIIITKLNRRNNTEKCDKNT